MSNAADSRELMEVLGEDFTRRLRVGEHPSIDAYADQHPTNAEEIRQLLATIAALEQARARRSSGPMLSLRDCPRQLGDYRLIHEIGRGGMGIVYEAEQVSLGRRVAVKVLPRDDSPDAAKRSKRFDREARVAAQLHHTNIVPVFGVGEADGFHYLVMQKIAGLPLDRVLANLAVASSNRDGQRRNVPEDRGPTATTAELNRPQGAKASLAPRTDPRARLTQPSPKHLSRDETSDALNTAPTQRIPAQRIPEAKSADDVDRLHASINHAEGQSYWGRVAETTADAANAIQYAHEQGILHRDIKPGNLLLDDDGGVWVADFGLARIFEGEASGTEDLAGTLRYMAPERFKRQCDVRSDVYSLGATLYEMLTLSPAFQADDRAEMLQKITEIGPKAPDDVRPEVPHDLATICMKAMSLSPSDRYATAAEFGEDLRRFANDLPISARRATWFERSWRWCRRNRAISVATGIALLMLAVTSIVSTSAYYRTREALQQNVEQHQRTSKALALSFDALDRLYSRFAPDDMFLASLPTVDSGDMTGLAGTDRPMLSAQAGAMLENLLEVYDQFAYQVGEEEEVLRRKLISSRRLGVIQTRLGQFERAEDTLLGALRRWPDGESSDMRLEKARLLNAMGGLYDFQQRAGDAKLAYQQALVNVDGLLDHVPDLTSSSKQLDTYEAAAYQTAQSCFLLGRSLQLFGSPYVSRSQRYYLSQAIEVLQPICSAHAADEPSITSRESQASFRRLLALCYREWSPSPMSKSVDNAISILSELCEQHPNNLSYRYDLSETLGLPASRSPSIPELELARVRLLDALTISQTLIDSQPNLPLYAESRSHLHRKLASVLLASGDRVEAAQHADMAVSAQEDLLRRFPGSTNYRVWHAVMTEMRARAEDDDSKLTLAIFELQNVVDDLTSILEEQPDSPLIAGPLASAYLTLARIQFQQLDTDAARESLEMAMQLRVRAATPNGT